MSVEGKNPIPLKLGSDFSGYRVDKQIGLGGYGVVYLVYDFKNRPYAMKCGYSSDKNGLLNEINIEVSLNDSPHFLHFVDSGEVDGIKFVIMELLGPSLLKVCRCCPSKRLSPRTWLSTSKAMLLCIKEFHEHFYIHRDIKPSNFLIRAGNELSLSIIDYGMAKAYLNTETMEIIPQSKKPSFNGTYKYCSPYAHQKQDLGRQILQF